MEIRGIRLGRSGNQGRCIFLPYYAPCFVATDQESKLGQFALITSAVSLVSYWACGKWFKPKFRKTGMLVGSILMLLVILPRWLRSTIRRCWCWESGRRCSFRCT